MGIANALVVYSDEADAEAEAARYRREFPSEEAYVAEIEVSAKEILGRTTRDMVHDFSCIQETPFEATGMIVN